jgi:branched-chain amino acid transport system permease protein
MTRGALLAAGVGVLAYFLFPSNFYYSLSINILIMTIYAMSLNLLIGYSGMISFGHAGFFGIGAYTMGILLQKTQTPFLLALLASIVLATGGAAIIGFFCVRLGTMFFAMLTLAFGQLIYTVIIRWDNLTGGEQGLIGGLPRRAIEMMGWNFDLTIPSNFYILTYILAILSIGICKVVVESPFGSVLRAIRDNAGRASFVGVNVRGHRLAVFTISGCLAGLAGALMSIFVSGAYPDFAYFIKSTEPVFMILLGGIYNFFGPLLGAFIFVLLDLWLSRLTAYWMLVLGVFLVLICVFIRGGILDYLGRVGESKAD